MSNIIGKFLVLACISVITLMLQACGNGDGNNDWFGKVPDDYINNITNSTNVTNSYNVENSHNVLNSYNVVNSSNVFNSYNVTNCYNVTNSSNIANMSNVANVHGTASNTRAKSNRKFTNTTQPVLTHTDMVNDNWFAGLTTEEKLCKKYLGQPQTPNLTLPTTYDETIDYLSKALFFFPDDPNQMTEEQYDLFMAPCFNSGLKGVFEFDNATKRFFNDDARKAVEIFMNQNRYVPYTKEFFNAVTSETFKNKYCTAIDSSMIWNGPAPAPNHLGKRDCSKGTTNFYGDGKPLGNYFELGAKTPLGTPIKNSPFITEMEVLLVARHIRFGGDGYEHFVNKANLGASARGSLGGRSSFSFDPMAIVNTIEKMGEIGINIGGPATGGLGTNPPFTEMPNSDPTTKNIVPNVSYWGFTPGNQMLIDGIGIDSRMEGLILHEMMHNMGYNHGAIAELDKLDQAGTHPLDIAYFVHFFFEEGLWGHTDWSTGAAASPYLANAIKEVIPNFYKDQISLQYIP